MGTKLEVPPEVREWYRVLGQRGGKARMEKMTARERSAIARRGGKAKAAKQSGTPTADTGAERQT